MIENRSIPVSLSLAALFVMIGLVIIECPAYAAGVVNTCDETNLTTAIAGGGGGGSVTFTCSGTITLTSRITISKDTTIDGTGQNVTISGNNSVPVFLVNSGVNATLNSLTITNGNAGGDGGGIMNFGTLTVTNSTISGNSAFGNIGGGGIYNSGTLTLTSSTISGNSASIIGGGGGIANDGTLTVTNSTISGNSASNAGIGGGGGIFNNGTLTVTNSTISGNSALIGGGILNSGILNYTNTIIANAPSDDCVNINGSIGTHTNNLVQDGTCSASLSGDPKLSTLGSYGGPTHTIALLPGSPAIDAGNDSTCAAFDQRGVARPQGLHCDIGAYELIPPVTVASATGKGVITLTPVTAGCWLSDVQAMATSQAYMADPLNYNYPYGLVYFKLHCPTPGQSADVTITFPGDISGMEYRKCGPTPPDFNTVSWYTYSSVTVNGNAVTLHLKDGALGDDTAADGIIVDEGGPGDPPTTAIPTMNEWGMIVFMVSAGLCAVYFLRRKRKV